MRITRGRILVAVLAVACVPLFAYLATGTTGAVYAHCLREEAKHYPALERVLARELRGVPHTIHHGSQCEDNGEPFATVRAFVSGWHTKLGADQYFLGRGWVHGDGYQLHSADGHYAIGDTPYTSIDKAGKQHQFVIVDISDVSRGEG